MKLGLVGSKKEKCGAGDEGKLWESGIEDYEEILGVLRVCGKNMRESAKLRSDARTGQWVTVDCWRLLVKGDSR